MKNGKLIKILGLVAAALGIGGSLLTEWLNEKKLDEKVEECVNAKLAERDENDEEEEDEEMED